MVAGETRPPSGVGDEAVAFPKPGSAYVRKKNLTVDISVKRRDLNRDREVAPSGRSWRRKRPVIFSRRGTLITLATNQSGRGEPANRASRNASDPNARLQPIAGDLILANDKIQDPLRNQEPECAGGQGK
jgi:hypothetical protein